MTACALHLCVLAQILLKLLPHFAMAVIAHLCKFRARSNLFLWRMRFAVTLAAGCNLIAVEKAVAGLTLRHDLFPVLFYRVIRMKFGVAFRALKLMFSPFVPELVIYARMTAAAFGRG